MKRPSEGAVWPPAPLQPSEATPAQCPIGLPPAFNAVRVTGIASCLFSVAGALLYTVPFSLARWGRSPWYFSTADLLGSGRLLLLVGCIIGLFGWRSALGKVGLGVVSVVILGAVIYTLIDTILVPPRPVGF